MLNISFSDAIKNAIRYFKIEARPQSPFKKSVPERRTLLNFFWNVRYCMNDLHELPKDEFYIGRFGSELGSIVIFCGPSIFRIYLLLLYVLYSDG